MPVGQIVVDWIILAIYALKYIFSVPKKKGLVNIYLSKFPANVTLMSLVATMSDGKRSGNLVQLPNILSAT